MYLKLYFSETEMCEYLAERGYSIFLSEEPVEVPVHGSVFITVPNKSFFAERNGQRKALREAFEFEIKKFLISNQTINNNETDY